MSEINPSPAERISILRHRTGLTQVEYAAKIQVSARRVRAWERGEDTPPPEHCPEIELTDGEKARILRRRMGLSLWDAGKLVNISHVTVIQAERNRSKTGKVLFEALLKRKEEDVPV